MSLEQAREILGPDYSSLTDEQIQKIIDLFKSISIKLIENYGNG